MGDHLVAVAAHQIVVLYFGAPGCRADDRGEGHSEFLRASNRVIEEPLIARLDGVFGHVLLGSIPGRLDGVQQPTVAVNLQEDGGCLDMHERRVPRLLDFSGVGKVLLFKGLVIESILEGHVAVRAFLDDELDVAVVEDLHYEVGGLVHVQAGRVLVAEGEEDDIHVVDCEVKQDLLGVLIPQLYLVVRIALVQAEGQAWLRGPLLDLHLLGFCLLWLL